MSRESRSGSGIGMRAPSGPRGGVLGASLAPVAAQSPQSLEAALHRASAIRGELVRQMRALAERLQREADQLERGAPSGLDLRDDRRRIEPGASRIDWLLAELALVVELGGPRLRERLAAAPSTPPMPPTPPLPSPAPPAAPNEAELEAQMLAALEADDPPG